MMFRLASLLLIASLLCFGQQPRAQLLVTGAGGVSTVAAANPGPGDVVASAKVWWGLRGYTQAFTGNAAQICTPLDVACLDVTVTNGILNATTLGTLACNNITVICTIKILYDQSGANSCGGAACNLTQATIANRPLYVVGATNGRPCMQHQASPATSIVNSTGFNLAQTFSFSTVAKRTGGTSNYGYVIFSSPLTAAGFDNGANSVFAVAGAIFNTAGTDNSYLAVQTLFNGSPLSSITVGNSTTFGNVGTSGLTAGNIQMGDASFPVTGLICEGGVWSGLFSGGNIAAMYANQQAWYAL